MFADNDFDGVPSPGDVLRYAITIANGGNGAATAVTLTDIPDSNTTLVSGALTTTQGSITSGNGGAPPVTVDVGTIAASASVTVTFDVTINALPPGVTSVVNQGTVASNELPALSTDDPSVGGSHDPTITQVTGTPRLRAQKTVTLASDNDSDGNPSPGDRLRYAISIVNAGNAAATGVVFNDTPDLNSPLLSGLVTTTQGVVTRGNVAGDAAVVVNVGTVPASGSVTIVFLVDINNPVAAGVTVISNQGRVSSIELPVALTDDPSQPGNSDPTLTIIDAAAVLRATKIATLLIDADGDGEPSPGDTVLYQVQVTNAGNSAATNVTLTDAPDSNTSLVGGSVITSRGSVVDGNGGAPPVTVNFGTIAGGSDHVTVSFSVTINNPLPGNVTHVTNQGSVSSDQSPTLVTDDPAVAGSADPTETSVRAAPNISATKIATEVVDPDDDGVMSPGDTLLYRVTIRNTGNAASTATSFNDLLDPNTRLVVSSVQTSTGTVARGNTSGDTSVVVTIGAIPGNGGSVIVTFQATINDPLPANVTSVRNQGSVSGGNFSTQLTDDPGTAVANDPTTTNVTTSPAVAVTKTAVLDTDADSNGVPSPGDTLRYQLSIRNSGNQAAAGVILSDTLDSSASLVVGSVQTHDGTVAVGHLPGDTAVVVNVGTLPGGGGSTTISFRVTIVDPLPPGVTQVSNQAQVTGTNFPAEPSDDPTTAAAHDPTVTNVTAAPGGQGTKTATLFVDADGDGVPSPGDTLLYQLEFTNTGNGGVTNVTAVDTLDPNTTLVVGSVQASQGTITSGNNLGDTSIFVDVGTIPGRGGRVTGSFLATINNPLPPGVTQVSNQAHGFVFGFPTGATDDPTTAAPNDATVTQVTTVPAGSANKTATLFNDADGNGVPSPGDTLLYRIDVVNSGNGAATGAFLNDNLDPNATLVVGSVQAGQGAITSGNSPGDTSVGITIGAIPGGGGRFTASFLAAINDPLPAGVTHVANQAVGGSNELPFVATDDPSTSNPNDATVTAVTAAPSLKVSKTDVLFTDADANGVPSPGDTLTYVIQIKNSGNTAATLTHLTDAIDANASLEVGSVQTTAGTVTSGNNFGDTNVAVDTGAIPGQGGTVTVRFLVFITDPLAPVVTQISNQAFVSSNELPLTPSDDPDTAANNDPTVTLVTAAPAGTADKIAVLFTDADGDGVPSPGDTLLYQLNVVNTGNGAGTGASLTDIPDPNTALVVGSVRTNQGTITSGNTAGDTSVAITIGTIAARGGRFTASFLVTINSPLPVGVTQVSNQATGSSNELPLVVTDDPSTAAPNDATVTMLGTGVRARPELAARKQDFLFIDADGNGMPSAGDTLLYEITITNSGVDAASNVVLSDLPDINTTLEVGSVTTTQGSVTGGNAGSPPVRVNLGTIPGPSGTATVAFHATINSPLPGGVTAVSNQGLVSSTEWPTIPTDDFDTPSPGDPTVTTLIAVPLIRTSKTVALLTDADGDGVASAGDTLQYNLTIRNDGNLSAVSTVLTDVPDPNSSLVVGSVTTSQGTVTKGNHTVDTKVQVNVGTIAGGGGQAILRFQVKIKSPLSGAVTQIANQAQVSGKGFLTQLSDDPTTPALSDPTRIALTAAPSVTAGKTAILLTDADNNGVPSPGDTLLYSIAMRNGGNVTADNVMFTDTPDANTRLVVGSVKTSAGTVLSGNVGTPPVSVMIGDLAVGATPMISFAVVVNASLPAGVTHVVNQGQVNGNNFATVLTDDPATSTASDATATRVAGLCGLTPQLACKSALKSTVLLYESSLAKMNKILWKFQSPASVGIADYGDPLHTTSYALCVYDSSAGATNRVMQVTVAPGGTCIGKACWQAMARGQGYRYQDTTMHADGLWTVWLRADSLIYVQAQGINLPVPAPADPGVLLMSQDPTVIVQFVNSDGGCWQTTYQRPASVNRHYQYRTSAAYLFRDFY